MSQYEWQQLNHRLGLTARELDVVKGIFSVQSEAAIAIKLGISINTVHTHLGRLYRKLGVHSASELILHVFREYVSRIRERNLCDS